MKRLIETKMKERILSGNLYVYGLPGSGKTTACLNVLNELGKPYLYFDCNVDRGLVLSLEKAEPGISLSEMIHAETGPDQAFSEELILVIDSVQELSKEVFLNLLNILPEKQVLLIGTLPLTLFGITEFPSVKVKPFSLIEWLTFMNHGEYAEMLLAKAKYRKPIPDFFHEELIEAFENYLLTGGFPDVCNTAKASNYDLSEIVAAEKRTSEAVLYELYLLNRKYGFASPEKLLQLTGLLYENYASYNKSDSLCHIRKGLTAKDFEQEYRFLSESGLCFLVKQSSGIRLECTDCGMFRYFAKDYNLFLETDDLHDFPRYVFQNYLYEECCDSERELTAWHSDRTAYLSLVDHEQKRACLCLSGSGFERSAKAFAEEYPNYEIIRIGIDFTKENTLKEARHNISYLEIAKTQL